MSETPEIPEEIVVEESEYGAGSIKVLKGLDAVKLNYIPHIVMLCELGKVSSPYLSIARQAVCSIASH